ncbi:MAG TPA: hypothetical protein VHC96_02745 [Puia sp.]|nr:hypothetical protein [Puia sp.]
MHLTYYGHACFSVVAGGKHILFDPFITGNDLAKNIRLEDVKAGWCCCCRGSGKL